MKKPFLPTNDLGLRAWLVNFSEKINTYATKYGLSAAEVTLIQQCCAFLIYWIDASISVKASVQAVNGFKNQIRDGVPAGSTPGITPPDITFSPPTAVDPGVVKYLRSIVARIKAYQTYSTNDGEALKIEGPENEVDIATAKPAFKIELVNGHPNLKWPKGIFQGVKIWVNRYIGAVNPNPGPTEFEFLAIDTIPDYLDTAQLPSSGNNSQTWGYMMKYIIDDEEVGLLSDPVLVTVTGPL